jgi:hypothetical protein
MLFFVFLLVAGLCLLCLIPTLADGLNLAYQKRVLAQALKIDTEKYPLHRGFPINYYGDTLTPEMTVTEVHQIIRGYHIAFRCGNDTEIYYYYSGDDRRALRFEVWYNQEYNQSRSAYGQMKFSSIRGEDSNSRTISIKGCEPGLLPEGIVYGPPPDCDLTPAEDTALSSLPFGAINLETLRQWVKVSPFKEAQIMEERHFENDDLLIVLAQNGKEFLFYFKKNEILYEVTILGRACSYTID